MYTLTHPVFVRRGSSGPLAHSVFVLSDSLEAPVTPRRPEDAPSAPDTPTVRGGAEEAEPGGLEDKPKESDCRPDTGVRVELQGAELWKRFYEIGTEMIITKAGRCFEMMRLVAPKTTSRISSLKAFGPLRKAKTNLTRRKQRLLVENGSFIQTDRECEGGVKFIHIYINSRVDQFATFQVVITRN